MGSSVFCISRERPFHAFGPMYAILLLYFSVFGFLIFINLFLPSLVITFVLFCFHPPKPLLLEIWNMCCSRCCYLLSFSFSGLASLCSSFVLYRFSLLSAHSRTLFCNTSIIGRIAFLYISSAAFSVICTDLFFSAVRFFSYSGKLIYDETRPQQQYVIQGTSVVSSNEHSAFTLSKRLSTDLRCVKMYSFY